MTLASDSGNTFRLDVDLSDPMSYDIEPSLEVREHNPGIKFKANFQPQFEASQQPLATATMTSAEKAHKFATSDKTGLFSRYRGSMMPVEKKVKNLTKSMRAAWDEVVRVIDELDPNDTEKHSLMINYTRGIIQYVSGTGVTKYVNLENPNFQKEHTKLLQLIQRVRQLGLEINRRLNWSPTQLNDRPSLPKPFFISCKEWEETVPKSFSSFIKLGHLKFILEHLPDTIDRNKAFGRICAAEKLAQQFKEALKQEQDTLNRTINENNFVNLPEKEQKEIRASLRDVKTLLEEFESLGGTFDRLPLYIGAAVCEKAETKEERIQQANSAASITHTLLKGKIKPEDDRGWMKKAVGWGKKEARELLGVRPFLELYAADVGDTMLQGDMETYERVDSQGRIHKAPSIVQMLMGRIRNLDEDGYGTPEVMQHQVGVLGPNLTTESRNRIASQFRDKDKRMEVLNCQTTGAALFNQFGNNLDQVPDAFKVQPRLGGILNES